MLRVSLVLGVFNSCLLSSGTQKAEFSFLSGRAASQISVLYAFLLPPASKLVLSLSQDSHVPRECLEALTSCL